MGRLHKGWHFWKTLRTDAQVGRLRWNMACVIMFGVASACTQALTPVALKALVDALTQHSALAAIEAAVIAYVGLIALSRFAAAGQLLAFGPAERTLQRVATTHVYAHLLVLEYKVVLSHKAGEIAQTVAEGLAGLRGILSALMFGIVPAVAQFLVISIVLVRTSQWVLLLSLACCALVYGLLFYRGNSRQRRLQQKAVQFDGKAAGLASDAMTNLEAVKLFAGERQVMNRLDTAFRDGERQWLGYYRAMGLVSGTQALAFTIFFGGMLIVSARSVFEGHMSVGSFVQVNAYLMQIVVPVERLSLTARELTHGFTLFGHMQVLLSLPIEAKGAAALPRSEQALSLEFESVRFGYEDDQPILDGLDLSIAPGERVAIVGGSGSGKSTIARLLFRLYEPWSGRISADGVPLDRIGLRALRRMMAVVPQDTLLFHDTLGNNIGFARPGASAAEIEDAARLAGLGTLLASLPEGLRTMAGERGLRLSGGERQRVAIARAIIKRPRLLVLDEATSALDGRTEHDVLESLLATSKSVTMIIIAHRLSTVVNADRIVVLEAGRVVEEGTHAQLLAQAGRYAAMWNAQYETPAYQA